MKGKRVSFVFAKQSLGTWKRLFRTCSLYRLLRALLTGPVKRIPPGCYRVMLYYTRRFTRVSRENFRYRIVNYEEAGILSWLTEERILFPPFSLMKNRRIVKNRDGLLVAKVEDLNSCKIYKMEFFLVLYLVVHKLIIYTHRRGNFWMEYRFTHDEQGKIVKKISKVERKGGKARVNYPYTGCFFFFCSRITRLKIRLQSRGEDKLFLSSTRISSSLLTRNQIV